MTMVLICMDLVATVEGVSFDRSRLDLSGDCSSSILLTHFHIFYR